MRVKTTNTRNGKLFYIIKTYYDTRGIEHTVTVEKLGNEHDIRERTGREPAEWAKERALFLTEKEKNEQKGVCVEFSPAVSSPGTISIPSMPDTSSSRSFFMNCGWIPSVIA